MAARIHAWLCAALPRARQFLSGAAGRLFRRILMVMAAGSVVAVGWWLWPQAKHCQLLFGPEGATALTLRVQRGRLAYDAPKANVKASRRSFDAVALPPGETIQVRDVASGALYTITALSRTQFAPPVSRDSLMVSVEIRDGAMRYQQYCDVELRRRSRTPAVAHFHGPLTVGMQTSSWRIPEGTRLVKGDHPTDVRVLIGTLDAQRGCWTVVRTHQGQRSAFADGVVPHVEVEFPPKPPRTQPVKERYALKEFC